MQGLALIFAIAGPLSGRHDIDAVIAENALQLSDVGEPRHVVQDQRFVGQKRRDHQGQCGILGPGNLDGAVEGVAADDANAIHIGPCRYGQGYRANGAQSKPPRPTSRSHRTPAPLRRIDGKDAGTAPRGPAARPAPGLA